MILCTSCNYENDDNTRECLNCGKPMLQYNSICGIDMLGGSSKNQLLNMRYIIEQQLSENGTGCTYKAEDAVDNTNVIIKALPLSVSLNSTQVEQLKQLIKLITSLSHPNINCLKTFEVHGKVRYFVYEYPEQQKKQFGNDISEQIRNEDAEKLAFETSARTKAESELQSYKDRMEKLQAEVKEEKQRYSEISKLDNELRTYLKQLETDSENNKHKYELQLNQLKQKIQAGILVKIKIEQKCTFYEQVIKRLETTETEQKDKLDAVLIEANKKLAIEVSTRKQIENKQTSYKDTIDHLQKQIAAEQQKHTEALHGVNWKVKALSNSLNQADEKIEVLTKENKAALDKVRTDTSRQQEYAQQLDKAYWKISVLSAEIEKLEKKSKKIKTAGIEVSPASKPKFAMMVSIFILVSIVIYVAGTYLYINFEKKNENLLEDRISVSHTLKHPNNKTITELSYLNTENKIATYDVEEETAKDKEESAVDIEPQEEHFDDEELFPKAAEEKQNDTVFELGLKYYTGKDAKQDYKKAFEYFFESAQAGNKAAMYNTGRMYHQGNGTEVNDTKALEWYEKAADAGLTKAMNQLAQMYYFGYIVKQDYKKAADYYEHSAKNGDLKAMYNLAILYHNGVGLEKDARKAMLWFIKAAREGDPDSMYQLGEMFESGISIKKDLEKAAHWYQNAAQAGHKDAQKELKKLNEKG